ncbi:MAG: carboxypeptidase regulatory-like domain-containing protein [Rhodothermales bacterium]
MKAILDHAVHHLIACMPSIFSDSQQGHSYPTSWPHTGLMRLILLSLLLFALSLPEALAQSATVKGFVTDDDNGESLQGVNVVLDNGEGGFYGTVTDNDGVYALSRVPPGRYVFQVSYIGFQVYQDTLLLRSGSIESIDIALKSQDTQLGEVFVEGTQPSGAARITAGLQSVRPQDIELVPAPDVSGDLATYLTTLPGVVAIGDRGGQLFVRGGEPSHNMALIDGMYVHQPFHILGFYSAFPADIINRADVYAGGFGSQFNGRISSVIDVYTRNGNKKRYGGNASIAPFVSAAMIEGPVGNRGRSSILGSIRQSVIKQGAQNYISTDLPYRFGDAFAKFHTYVSDNSQLSFSFLNTHDSGVLGEPTVDRVLDEIRWKNTAFGVRYLFLSGSKPFLGELIFSVSRMHSEVGPSDAPIRQSDFNSFNYAVNFTNFVGRTEWKYGIFTRAPSVQSELGGLYQGLQLSRGKRHKIGLYVEPDVHINANLRARIGIVAMMFTGNKTNRIFEPRARLVWEDGPHEISAAVGQYHQEVIGLTDRRDATNIFTAWASAPSEKLTDATHAILGYRFHPTPSIEIGTEAFYKKFDNIFIAEWTSFPRFTTRMQRASGQAIGWDLRMEVRQPNFYGYVNYGLSSVKYKAKQASLPLWYGTDELKFRPPQDRRHQLNVLVSTTIKKFDMSARWNFGSGLPYNRVVGFDGFVLLDGIQNLFDTNDDRRVIYDLPFNGVLPTYHRLDISVDRKFTWDHLKLTLQAGVINVYNRRNLLALDIFTLRRSDQLPIIPTLGVKIEFE